MKFYLVLEFISKSCYKDVSYVQVTHVAVTHVTFSDVCDNIKYLIKSCLSNFLKQF